eukprot:TRINITY_DN3684_c0_g1_i3.p1 TRINITY_DN3684_c0_g1~~TRINITY_DN3684_c0_g1_i3.p1  ORF type:complete len:257 (+),score=52.28 TRINITY_DN3684_c0_g1_i3:64-834(+)
MCIRDRYMTTATQSNAGPMMPYHQNLIKLYPTEKEVIDDSLRSEAGSSSTSRDVSGLSQPQLRESFPIMEGRKSLTQQMKALKEQAATRIQRTYRTSTMRRRVKKLVEEEKSRALEELAKEREEVREGFDLFLQEVRSNREFQRSINLALLMLYCHKVRENPRYLDYLRLKHKPTSPPNAQRAREDAGVSPKSPGYQHDANEVINSNKVENDANANKIDVKANDPHSNIQAENHFEDHDQATRASSERLGSEEHQA